MKKQITKQLNKKTASEQMRVVRGYAIISKGDVPKKIGKETYTVPSQAGNGDYTITNNGSWKCTCPDFEKRNKNCKHINAVKFYLELQEKIKDSNLEVEEVKEKPNCFYCGSPDIIKFGKRKTETMIKQKYRCNECKKVFIQEKDFERVKGDSKITTLMLDLYFKGISFRGIQDHLKQFYNLEISHSNILRRVHKFSKVINKYVKTLNPEISEVWHVDEMKIQANGKWKWLWNVMDEKSKFLITQKVTDCRKQTDSAEVFKEAREQVKGKQPVFMVTDGCHSYKRAINSELPETSHIQLKSIRDKRRNNNDIERLNGSVRDRIKTMRGMQNINTSQGLMDGFNGYYNFVRVHSALGTTPAIKSGLNGVGLDGNRWKQLLEKSFS